MNICNNDSFNLCFKKLFSLLNKQPRERRWPLLLSCFIFGESASYAITWSSTLFVLSLIFLNHKELVPQFLFCIQLFEWSRIQDETLQMQQQIWEKTTFATWMAGTWTGSEHFGFSLQRRQIAQLSAFLASKRLSSTPPLSTTARNSFMRSRSLISNQIISILRIYQSRPI